ncbi:hypothetical protein [Catenuloplanes japonicus]|uniref:hypothetical protein n=1 Tax=Catenuloplanes japonicus TaxID=33876 RepID=UPI0005261E89|nr:hypothetical protein [Catenuloplanes japonicus]
MGTEWPETPFPLDLARLDEAYLSLRDTPAPFSPGPDWREKAFGPDPDDLAAVPAFMQWTSSHMPLRWAALRVLTAAYPSGEPLNLAGPVTLDKGVIRVWPGDVHIDGNLVLDRKARVIVLGTLTVTGALVAPPYGYSLVGARAIVCRDGVSAGEILATESVTCPGTFLLSRDTHTAMSPLFTGGTLVDYMWPARFSRVDVTTRVTGGMDRIDHAAAEKALGVRGDHLDDLFAAKLLKS